MSNKGKVKRRDFIVLSGTLVVGAGIINALGPFVSYLGPDANSLAQSTVDVDIKSMSQGQSIKVLWRGKPIFIRNRTEKEIEDARLIDIENLPDPQTDQERVIKDNWLIVVGVCTHLGCVPIGQKGDYGGWYCPCHGSHYDTSGRIRKGPAPRNLDVPPYFFVEENIVRIGAEKSEVSNA